MKRPDVGLYYHFRGEQLCDPSDRSGQWGLSEDLQMGLHSNSSGSEIGMTTSHLVLHCTSQHLKGVQVL